MSVAVQHKPCYCGKHELLRDGVGISCVSVLDNRDPRKRSSNYHSGDWCSWNFDEGLPDVGCGCGRYKLPGEDYGMKVIWTTVETRATGWDIRIVVSEWHQAASCAEDRNRSFA